MSKIPKTQTLYYQELDNEINDWNEYSLRLRSEIPPSDQILYRTKYRFNPKVFDNDFESKSNILLPFPYEYAKYKKGNFLRNKTIKKSKKNFEEISNIINKIDNYNNEEEETESENENESNNSNTQKKEKKNFFVENDEIFFEERIPQDDVIIGQPLPNKNDFSDIEIDFNEDKEELDENKTENKQNNNFISEISDNNSKKENDNNSSEHILNKVKSPIDMINIGEKIYELFSINYNTKDNEDLISLNIFKKKNSINIDPFKNIKMTGQTIQFLQNGKFFLNDFTSTEQKDEVPTEMIIDNKDYKTNCSIWFGTNKGNLIRIPICNKPSKDCQGIVINSEEVGISAMDIFENFIIMGHFNGTIQIWDKLKIIDKSKDVKAEILQIKFIKVNLRKSKFEYIYSDLDGNVKYVKKSKRYFGSKNKTEGILSCKEFPVYKICIYNKEKDLKISKKKNIIISLVSLNNISLYKKSPKKECQLITLIEIPKGLNFFSFDCDFGYGFPPIFGKNIILNKTIIDEFSEEIENNEKLLFVASYGIIIRAFEIIFDKNFSVQINEISHYISDHPILKISFINKSLLAILDANNSIKLINTFCFENEVFSQIHSPTNNDILSYQKISIKDILKQNKGIIGNISDNYLIKKMNYLSSIIVFQDNIFIMQKQQFSLIKLYNWEEILTNLYQDEKYKEMIWILTALLATKKNILSIENISGEFENTIQECLYFFLTKGTSKKNNYNEIKLFIEYCLITGRYKDFYSGKKILTERKLEDFLYEYSSEYILKRYFYGYEFEIDFIKGFINYYLKKHEPILLSEILLKLSINNLNDPEIIKILDENILINPFIYAKMKERDKSNIDYFNPIEFLFNKYESKIKENDKENPEYIKLMTEHNMKYYYDKALACNDFLGHKLLWYIDKCLRNEEYPKNNCLPQKEFEDICKKILLFLTLDNVMNILLKFDSFSYFQLLTKLFTEYRLYKLVKKDLTKNI